MRVLMVTGIFPPDHGGPASYVPAIAGALQQEGHEIVAVVTLSDAPQDDAHWGFPVIRIPRKLTRFMRTVQVIWLIRNLAQRADVVYLNGLFFEGIVACKMFSRRPVVIKVVGDLIWERAINIGAVRLTLDEFQAAPLPKKLRALRQLQAAYVRMADRVITPSRYLSKIVQGWGVPVSRLAVIYNVSDLEVLPPPPYSDVDLVTVARLVPWKGLESLIDLAASEGWSLNIVGDGPLRKILQSHIAALGPVGYRIRLLGGVSKVEVADAIRAAKVFVLNSSYEGLPHIVLEAKAVGVPVIATAVGGTAEVVHDGVDGLLVPFGDTPALRRAVESLLHDPARRSELVDAASHQLRGFSFRHMVQETETLLLNCVPRETSV